MMANGAVQPRCGAQRSNVGWNRVLARALCGESKGQWIVFPTKT